LLDHLITRKRKPLRPADPGANVARASVHALRKAVARQRWRRFLTAFYTSLVGICLSGLIWYGLGATPQPAGEPAAPRTPAPYLLHLEDTPAYRDDKPVVLVPSPEAAEEEKAIIPAPPPGNRRPAWKRYAALSPLEGVAGGRTRPMIAIVIDDMGLSPRRTKDALTLAAPVTFSFLPYGDHLEAYAAQARRSGHEVLVHMPMESLNDWANPGPNALLTWLDDAELRRRLRWNLGRLSGFVGINNHMGSRFSTDAHGMAMVMEAMAARGLLYLDSRTVTGSLGGEMARARGVPTVERDVFLDNQRTAQAIRAQLARLEDKARQNGLAVAIGHPHQVTIMVLRDWLATIARRGFVIVPITAIAERQRATWAVAQNR
jgi:polysaccharide deacetylase 2 family uncharacterized protein YibQ